MGICAICTELAGYMKRDGRVFCDNPVYRRVDWGPDVILALRLGESSIDAFTINGLPQAILALSALAPSDSLSATFSLKPPTAECSAPVSVPCTSAPSISMLPGPWKWSLA